jgi:sodium transport system permease protein
MSPTIRAVFIKELRDALRDRRTLFASVVVPILLYPVMLLLMAEVMQHAHAKMQREAYTVAVPAGTKTFLDKISQLPPDDEISVEKRADKKEEKGPEIAGVELKPFLPPLTFVEMDADVAAKALTAGEVRAVIDVPIDFEQRVQNNQALPVIVKFDQAEHRSLDANQRVKLIFERYKREVVKQRLDSKALTTEFLKPFEYNAVNVAVATKVGGSMFGTFLPLIFIMMIITGAMYPAIDMTAGEKERSTLETLIGSPCRPIEIITGKFLAVAAMAVGSAALNVFSFGGTFSLLPAQSAAAMEFPWSALPATLLLLVPLTLLFSALLIAVSCFAANNKEAQIYCLPIYLVPVVGMMVTMMPGIELEGPLLLAPVVNITLMIKELFLGHGGAQNYMFVFLSTCLYAAGAVALAGRVFAREEVLFSAQGSFRLFLKRRFFRPAELPRPGDSLLVLALLFPINFYVQNGLAKALVDIESGVIPTSIFALLVIIPQYLLFLALPIAIAWYLKLDLKKTFLWRMPSLRAVLGAVCLGFTAWIIMQQVISWQSMFWPFPTTPDPTHTSISALTKSGWGMALGIFLIGLTPGICEEHLFRGFMQQGLVKSGKWFALLLVGIVFGAYHIKLFNQPVLMAMGVVLAYVAWETRSIWPGVVFHFLHNSIQVVLPTLVEESKPVSGEPLPGMPLNWLLPAIAIFALGIFLIRRSAKTAAPKTNGAPPSEHRVLIQEHALRH